MFAEEMKRHNIEEIGEYKIREWLDKIDYWMRIAGECKDREFVKSCEQAIRDVKAYFNLQ